MVAQPPESETRSAPSDPPTGDGLPHLFSSLRRVIDLQIRIWLTHAKLTAARIAFFTLLFTVAALFAFLAAIFLFIGLFHVLTDIIGLQKVYAYLLFGGFNLLLTATLLFICIRLLNGPENKDDQATAPASTPPASPEDAQ